MGRLQRSITPFRCVVSPNGVMVRSYDQCIWVPLICKSLKRACFFPNLHKKPIDSIFTLRGPHEIQRAKLGEFGFAQSNSSVLPRVHHLTLSDRRHD